MAPFAGLIRSISPPPVDWLSISNVCQPGPGTDHALPHWLLLTVITFCGFAGLALQAARPAARPAASAALAVASRRLGRITIRDSSGRPWTDLRGASPARSQHRVA